MEDTDVGWSVGHCASAVLVSTTVKLGACESAEGPACVGGMPSVMATVGTYDEYDNATSGGHLGVPCEARGTCTEETDTTLDGCDACVTPGLGKGEDMDMDGLWALSAVGSTKSDGGVCLSVAHVGDAPHWGMLVAMANDPGAGMVHPVGVASDEVGMDVAAGDAACWVGAIGTALLELAEAAMWWHLLCGELPMPATNYVNMVMVR